MLYEHRVLTSTQVKDLAFPSLRAANQRLLELHRCRVINRFQPLLPRGSAPMHYVLDTAGAAVLAAEHGLDTAELRWRRDRAIGIAHSLQLAHTIGVNTWFTALAAHGSRNDEQRLSAWWSETRCARLFGDLARPDGYGRWALLEFFLEFDLGTEPHGVVASKLRGYAALAAATAITTPILFWLPTARREAGVRRALAAAQNELDHDPTTVPVATAAADLLNHTIATPPSPAADVWLPLGDSRQRRRLADLATVWPHVARPTAPRAVADGVPADDQLGIPAPEPTPPRLSR